MKAEDWTAYWNKRWQGDPRGGVSPYQTVDELYEGRNARDAERLAWAFEQTKQNHFQSGIETGAGSGRLTPIMLSMCDNLVCVDGSEVATEFRRKQFPDLQHIVTLIKDLPTVLPPGTFDLAMTFTVVQHINDFNEWDASLKAIQAMLAPGGFYVMHEDISASVQKRVAASHMNDRTVADYTKALDQCDVVNSQVLYYQPSNEYDLLAVWKKR